MKEMLLCKSNVALQNTTPLRDALPLGLDFDRSAVKSLTSNYFLMFVP
jgi:hypothetical protein